MTIISSEMDKKAIDAKRQLLIWNRLLEGRIQLQNLLAATNKLCLSETNQNHPAVRSISKLLNTLLRLRCTLVDKSQAADEPQDDDELFENEITETDLKNLHEKHKAIRDKIIDKWYEKTKIGAIPRKGYSALELSPLQLIEHALRDKQRLIRRTKLNRATLIDEDYSPEIFNDDDFYHQLLKETISKDENRRWVELQRARGKSKRKVDTRASKGRKIRMKTHPKLVNFMAPRNIHDQDTLSEEIKTELLSSLFGNKN